MPNGPDDFRQRLKHETEPLAIHGLCALLLEVLILLVGLGLRLLLWLFPDHKEHLQQMESVDIWAMLILFCMFAVYAIIQIGIRLWSGVVVEWREKRLNEASPRVGTPSQADIPQQK